MIYIMISKPHTEDIFISLEYFNEGLLIVLCYLMLIYSGTFGLAITLEKIPLYVSIGITVLIVVGNFGVLLRNSILKIKLMCTKQ